MTNGPPRDWKRDLSHRKMAPAGGLTPPGYSGGNKQDLTPPASLQLLPTYPHGTMAATGKTVRNAASASRHPDKVASGIIIGGKSIATDDNVARLATVIQSEAGVYGGTAQAMVGWTIVNRMKSHQYDRVSSVIFDHGHRQYASNQPATSQTLRIAREILSGRAHDISGGATYFYSPQVMPKEKDADSVKHGKDIGGGLESVTGVVDKKGAPARNYRLSWANYFDHVAVPGLDERNFKFYRGK